MEENGVQPLISLIFFMLGPFDFLLMCHHLPPTASHVHPQVEILDMARKQTKLKKQDKVKRSLTFIELVLDRMFVAAGAAAADSDAVLGNTLGL